MAGNIEQIVPRCGAARPLWGELRTRAKAGRLWFDHDSSLRSGRFIPSIGPQLERPKKTTRSTTNFTLRWAVPPGCARYQPMMEAKQEPVLAGRNRILTLDGGGVRGFFSIEILGRMEQMLRDHLGKPRLVLADHFDFIAGTSTGAIIATLLSWGEPVEAIRKLYNDRCREIFPKFAPWKVWHLRRVTRALYNSEPLSVFLRNFFIDPDTQETALLRTKRLRTKLLVCMRNATTGSAWPITNNPNAKYNLEDIPDCNLNIPLWQLVRASTAAPVFFLPEKIKVGSNAFAFMDGGVTSYNNPALIASLMATLPCYKMEWPAGKDRLLLVSIGTGRIRSVLTDASLRTLNIGISLASVPGGLMENVSLQQDFICRIIGSCVFGDPIDSEIGDLIQREEEHAGEEKKFSYVRYDHRFMDEEVASAEKQYGRFSLSNTRMIPFLAEIGKNYAERNVRIEHLL
jgi:patatin-like phospholipase/acyl hydrolase